MNDDLRWGCARSRGSSGSKQPLATKEAKRGTRGAGQRLRPRTTRGASATHEMHPLPAGGGRDSRSRTRLKSRFHFSFFDAWKRAISCAFSEAQRQEVELRFHFHSTSKTGRPLRALEGCRVIASRVARRGHGPARPRATRPRVTHWPREHLRPPPPSRVERRLRTERRLHARTSRSFEHCGPSPRTRPGDLAIARRWFGFDSAALGSS